MLKLSLCEDQTAWGNCHSCNMRGSSFHLPAGAAPKHGEALPDAVGHVRRHSGVPQRPEPRLGALHVRGAVQEQRGAWGGESTCGEKSGLRAIKRCAENAIEDTFQRVRKFHEKARVIYPKSVNFMWHDTRDPPSVTSEEECVSRKVLRWLQQRGSQSSTF